MSDFGELRSLLQAFDDDARRRAWPRLLELFDGAFGERPAEVAEVWMPYALQALERWPDRFRYAPTAWLERMADGEDLGLRMALIKALRLLTYDGELLTQVCGRRELEWVRHVELLSGCLQGDAVARALEPRDLFPRLSSLEISGARVRAHLWPTAWFTPQLESLTLSDCALDEVSGLKIFGEADFARLRALDVSDNHALAGGIFALARAEVPCLKDLDVSRSWVDRAHLEGLCGASWWPGLGRVRLERSIDSVRYRSRLGGLDNRQKIGFVDAALGSRLDMDRFLYRNRLDTQRERAHLRTLGKAVAKLNREEKIERMLRGSGLDDEVLEGALEGVA